MMYLHAIDRETTQNTSVCKPKQFRLFRLHCEKEIVSSCFATNKQNYALYGTCYCVQLENLDRTHPGAEEELQNRGLFAEIT